jgi:phage tail sheath protein FI
VRLSVTLDLQTDAHAAARLLADPEFVHQVVRASGAIEQHVDVTGSPEDAFTVTTRRALPTDQIPSHLRSFVGTQIDVRQVEAWEPAEPDGSRVGTVVVEIAGAPVRLSGRTALTAGAGASAGTSTVSYDGELRASVPLFGSAIEQATAGAIRSALDVEREVADRWIAGHGQAPQP